MNLKCKCQYCLGDKYYIDINSFNKKRDCGISGILRVKNDAEFLAESIDSCVEALDELIIVYNGCTDGSPDIIRRKAKEYGSKIKYYEYEPIVYANNLSEEEYEFIKSQPSNSPHLLANYYNLALSKVSYMFVMKIDADQIYFTDELQQLCDAYRCKSRSFMNPWKLLCFVYFYLNLLLYKKIGISFPFRKQYLFRQYREFLLVLVRNFKIPVYLSGYNMFYKDKSWYVSLGKKNEGRINILPPYNGVTDHSLFCLSARTYFAPVEMKEYTQLNSHRHSLIEILCGLRIVFPYGFIWMHLNGMRQCIYMQQVTNWIDYNERFMLFRDFVEKKFDDVRCTSDSAIISRQSRLFYSVLHDVIEYKEEINKFITKYCVIVDGGVVYLKKGI